MKKGNDAGFESMEVTASLIKENSELKSENRELKSMLTWCWCNPGTVFMRKFIDSFRGKGKFWAVYCDRGRFDRVRFFIHHRLL